MKKILLTALTLALAIGGATAVFAAVGDDPAPSHTSRTTSTAQDVPGPCDEAEHASDPRCAPGVPAEDPAGEVDNSGPGSVNSGPGSTSSGPSGEADDHGGESGHSGPGGGGEDNDG